MTETLAINGGTPLRSKPWHESNAIGKEEEEAVLSVMRGGRLSLFQGAYNPAPPYSFLGGPTVQAFEKQAAEMIGCSHVVSMNSATSCLSAAIGALGLGVGDEVIVSPYTMSADAVAPLWYGAIPVFADIEEDTGCLDPRSIQTCLTDRTKAILVIHQFGIPADMDAIMAIAKERGLFVIEDAAQAWGAMYRGRSVGTIGHIGIHSLNVHKTIQCGEGGLCMTNDPALALRLQMIRNHGEAVVADAKVEDITNIVGANFRLTEIQAAIAIAQLKKLPDLNAKRVALVELLQKELEQFPFLTVPKLSSERQGTYYVFPVRYKKELLKNISRKTFAEALKAEGIPFAEGYVKPLYLLPLFQKKIAFKNGYPWAAPENAQSHPPYTAGTCPVTERLYSDELLLNLYVCPPQTEDDIRDIIAGIAKVASLIA